MHRGTPGNDRGRDWGGAAANQTTPRTGGHLELGRGEEGFCPESQKDHDPVDILILDLRPLDL